MYKVLKHFLCKESGEILIPGSPFDTENKEVIELLLTTGYIEEQKTTTKKTTKKKAGGSDVIGKG